MYPWHPQQSWCQVTVVFMFIVQMVISIEKKRNKSPLKETLNNPGPNIAHWATPKTRSSLVSKCCWIESFVVYLSGNHNLISMKRGWNHQYLILILINLYQRQFKAGDRSIRNAPKSFLMSPLHFSISSTWEETMLCAKSYYSSALTLRVADKSTLPLS